MSRCINGVVGTLVATVATASLLIAPGQAQERFTAKLQPLNADKIGRSASGTASFEIEGGNLAIAIDASGLTPGLLHMQHFHGFPDGKDAECPTASADVNGDGYVDLLETEPAAGTTMVPFHAHPATLEIPSDTYPVADKSGAFHYQKTESVEKLENGLQEKFKAPGLALAKRVIIVHGVAPDTKLPDTVKSLPGVPAQMTLPVACGAIEAAG
jgi:hypothetical protein